MDYQSKKNRVSFAGMEKERMTAHSRTTVDKGVSRGTHRDEERLNFKFIVPWQLD